MPQNMLTQNMMPQQQQPNMLMAAMQQPQQQQQAPVPPPSQQSIDQAHEHLEFLQDNLRHLLDKKDLDVSDIFGKIADLTGEYSKSNGKKGIPIQEGLQQLNTLPLNPDGTDPNTAQLKQWLLQIFYQVGDHRSDLTQKLGPSSKSMMQG